MRMKKFLTVLLLALLCVQPVFAKAKDKAKDKKEAKQPAQSLAQAGQMDLVKQEKDILIVNITNMRNQELRVAVLQQLLTEASAMLDNVQAAFCNQYKLDIQKLRQGLYRYDEKENKFVEVKEEK